MSDNIPMYDIYQEHYTRISTSKVFSEYCNLVFGLDLAQDGFSDVNQIDVLIKTLGINRNDICLDIGCGNGKIANYVSNKTSSQIFGIDYSEFAISDAGKIPNPNLHFYVNDINKIIAEKEKYSVIYLIDSIYFSNDYKKTIEILYESLKSGGRIGIYYSDFIFDKDKQVKKIANDETEIAKIFYSMNLQYNYIDFTMEHFQIMKKKWIISDSLKDEFIAEGNNALYNRANTESIKPETTYNEFCLFSNRYFYWLNKK
jgi:ubiquinone/menaquinone biosynthesis C-methylase UbiE